MEKHKIENQNNTFSKSSLSTLTAKRFFTSYITFIRFWLSWYFNLISLYNNKEDWLLLKICTKAGFIRTSMLLKDLIFLALIFEEIAHFGFSPTV